MTENWAGIAGEVAAAIREVGFVATLIKAGAMTGPDYDPSFAPSTSIPVTVIDDQIQFRDQTGALVGKTVRILTMGVVSGVVPAKGDRVAVRGREHAVLAVTPLAPGGVDLLYDVEIEG